VHKISDLHLLKRKTPNLVNLGIGERALHGSDAKENVLINHVSTCSVLGLIEFYRIFLQPYSSNCF